MTLQTNGSTCDSVNVSQNKKAETQRHKTRKKKFTKKNGGRLGGVGLCSVVGAIGKKKKKLVAGKIRFQKKGRHEKLVGWGANFLKQQGLDRRHGEREKEIVKRTHSASREVGSWGGCNLERKKKEPLPVK